MTYQAALIGGPGDGKILTITRDQPWQYIHRAARGHGTVSYRLDTDEQGTPRTDEHGRITYHYEEAQP